MKMKKLLALVLSVVMIISTMSFTVNAADVMVVVSEFTQNFEKVNPNKYRNDEVKTYMSLAVEAIPSSGIAWAHVEREIVEKNNNKTFQIHSIGTNARYELNYYLEEAVETGRIETELDFYVPSNENAKSEFKIEDALIFKGAAITVNNAAVSPTLNANSLYSLKVVKERASAEDNWTISVYDNNNAVLLGTKEGDAQDVTKVQLLHSFRTDACYNAVGNLTATFDNISIKVYKSVPATAEVNGVGYTTLQEAVNAAEDGDTIEIFGEVEEGKIKLPAVIRNLTIEGNGTAVIKNTTVTAADGNVVDVDGLTFNGITFDNSNIVITGWRAGVESVKNLTFTNNVFKNIVRTSNEAAIHLNASDNFPYENVTVKNNIIDGVSGASNSGIYTTAVDGKFVVEDNTIKSVAFRPFIIQIANNNGTADSVTVEGNTFSDSPVGRLQILGKDAEGKDAVEVVITNNVIHDVTDDFELCCWKFNDEYTTKDLSGNYWGAGVKGNASDFYWNGNAASDEELFELGIYPIYTDLNEDGTINEESVVTGEEFMAAKIGDKGYTSLQKAIDAAEDGDTVTFVSDVITDDVTITQKADVDVIIDGNGKTFSGTMYIWGDARYTGAETLTIQNVNFVTEKDAHDFISSNETGSKERYAHNVTIKDCTFTATEESTSVVATRFRQAYNIKMEGCKATNLHSVMWATGCSKVVVEDLKATDCKSGGLSFGTTISATVTGSTIETTGKKYSYAIRTDASSADYSLTVANSTLTANVPVLARKAVAGYDLTVSNSSLNANEGSYAIVAIKNDYDEKPENANFTAPEGDINLTVDNGSLVSYPSAASVDGKRYSRIADALAAIEDNSSVVIYAGEYDEVLAITEKNVKVTASGDVKFTKAPSLKGQDWYVEGIDFEYENDGASNTYVSVFNCDGTLKDCNFTSTGHTLRWAYGDSKNEDQKLTIEGCVFKTGNPSSQWAIHFDQTHGADIIVKNSKFDGRVAITGDHKLMEVSGSEFTGKYVNTYNDVTYEDCTFDVSYIYTGGKDVVVSFTNCTSADGKEIVDILYNKQSGVFVNGELATNGYRVGDVEYGRLQDAIDAVNGNGTIVLTGDVYATATVSAPVQTMALRNAPAVTIDLKGYTLNGSLMVLEGANVNIINGSIVNTNKNVSAVETLGNTTFKNVNITSKRHAVRVDGNGSAVIDGGIYKLNNTENMSIYVVNASANASVTINDGTFIGDGGLNEASAAVKSRDNAVVKIYGGMYSKGVTNTLSGEKKENIEVYYGIYDQDPSAYLADGYAVALNAVSGLYEVSAEDTKTSEIKVVFEEVASTNEDIKVYNIVLKADSKINEFASAELTFVNESELLEGGTLPYVITPAKDMTLSTVKGKPHYYGFAMEGDTEYEITSDKVVLGKVTFTGYGKLDFSVETGIVNATTVMNNLVKTFVVGGSATTLTKGNLIINDKADNGVIDSEIKVPVRTLTVNVKFPNAVANKDVNYQDMRIEITGNFDGENKTVTYDMGVGADKVQWVNDAYVLREENLVLNNSYTVAVYGAGYRTARYTVTMTEDKTLNFWNNVMTNKQFVEEKEDSSKTTKNFLAGDIVKDNKINIYDLSAVVSYFGEEGLTAENHPEYAKYDLNRDGKIDSKDVAYVLVSWGE